jgi:hypothetical protein
MTRRGTLRFSSRRNLDFRAGRGRIVRPEEAMNSHDGQTKESAMMTVLAIGVCVMAVAMMASAVPAGYAGRPWQGRAQAIPGKVKAVFYDEGGEGVAYHDLDTLNPGSGNLNQGPGELNNFRKTEGVGTSYTKPDMDKTVAGQPEPTGVLYLGWTAPGEWVNYTVDVATAGTYTINAHMSSNNTDAEIALAFNGVDKTGPIVVASTGHWHTWQMYEPLAEVTLEKGPQVMTLRFLKEGNMNVDFLEFIPKK